MKILLPDGILRTYRIARSSARFRRSLEIARNDARNRILDRELSWVKINQPLILITQIQRSGGTLLSQLFDGHPECFSYPHELLWGYPRKWYWPSPENKYDPRSVFDRLRSNELRFLHAFIHGGYRKYASLRPAHEDESYPFLFNLKLQKKIFVDNYPRQVTRNREILDLYLTSFFNAWLDYQGLYGRKKYVAAFVPRLNMYEESVAGFFSDYPQGYLITMVRHPGNWYASAKKHGEGHYVGMGIRKSLDLWAESTRQSRNLKQKYDRVILLRFEDLVTDLERVIRRICETVGLTWSESLTTPTFNSIPVYSDSSFQCKKGLDSSVLGRYKSDLTAEEMSHVRSYLPLYEEVE